MRRRGIVAVLAAVLMLTASACEIRPVNSRCTGTGFDVGGGNILRCTNGRRRVVMTVGQYLQILQVAKERQQATEERSKTFRGLGAWVDVYDWSPSWSTYKTSGSSPKFKLDAVDVMATAGVQVLFLQTGKDPLPDPLDGDLARQIIDRAHSKGIRVVGWYLPTHADNAQDLTRLDGMLAEGVDGVALDIEDRSTVPDLSTRNPRLIDLSNGFRAAHPTTPFSAVVLPPVVTDVINTNYWPSFPWAQLAGAFDVWMPMGYWSNRKADSGYRDGYRYTAENIQRLRDHLGANVPVHPIGGIANEVTDADIDGFVRAATEAGAIGGSMYDDATSNLGQYQRMASLRR